MNTRLNKAMHSTLTTQRLTLKPIDESVAEQIFEHFNEQVTKFMCPSPAQQISETLAFIHAMQKGREACVDFVYSIHLRANDEFIGTCGLHDLDKAIPELGIWTKIPAHGHGYGREAIAGLIDVARTVGYQKLRYPVDAKNIPSKKIPLSFGGVLVAEHVLVDTPDGRTLDEEIYHITVKNYSKKQLGSTR